MKDLGFRDFGVGDLGCRDLAFRALGFRLGDLIARDVGYYHPENGESSGKEHGT